VHDRSKSSFKLAGGKVGRERMQAYVCVPVRKRERRVQESERERERVRERIHLN
jgi:hypothetical protein